jgi:hypothetical protein
MASIARKSAGLSTTYTTLISHQRHRHCHYHCHHCQLLHYVRIGCYERMCWSEERSVMGVRKRRKKRWRYHCWCCCQK